jgi:quercetin dioxygenase-like cupin family protein
MTWNTKLSDTACLGWQGFFEPCCQTRQKSYGKTGAGVKVRLNSKEHKMSDTVSTIYFPETNARAVFAADGPRPQFLLDSPQFKVLVVGLQAGQKIPLHPGEPAMYYFLEGEGAMTVGDETFAINPGVTIIAQAGVPRGMTAKTKLVFLGTKGA